MLKHKRVVLIAFAVLFLVLLFFTKNSSRWTVGPSLGDSGLVYGDELVGDVLSRDTDTDGVLDWEEGLWGMDPGKADTNSDGVSDKDEIAKLKAERMANVKNDPAYAEASAGEDENLTQTDKFARELFTTVTALNQAGEIDDGTVAEITDSLAIQIQNPVQRKVFTEADLKITENNNKETYQKYADLLDSILEGKYPFGTKVSGVLQKFSEGGEDADSTVLEGLDPVLSDLSQIIEKVSKMEVPSEISRYHLELTNDFQIVFENLTDLRQIDKDPIRTYGAISQYSDNQEKLDISLATIVNLLLGNPL